jgi:uncharacterized membrane protein (DUF2068 family)
MQTGKRSYLRAIALWKLAKGVLLIFFGASLLFLDIREPWYVAVVGWIDDALLTPRKGVLYWLLQKILAFLVSDHLRTTGIIALIYAAVLCVEGVGVYLEQRWAEWLMVIATGSLIPLEIYHLVEKFTWVRLAIIIVNVAVVWYLWLTLRASAHAHTQEEATAAAPPA